MTPTPTSSTTLRNPGQGQDAQKKRNKIPQNDFRDVNKPKFTAEYEADFVPPSFTIKEIRDSVPAHLFERSLLKSSAYVLTNLFACFTLFYIATYFDSHLPFPLTYVAWPTYWWFQGVGMMGLWHLAHEAGHLAFSDYKVIDHAVGLFIHSIELVPFHGWRISHAQHHASTGHAEDDQLYVPKRRSEWYPDMDKKDILKYGNGNDGKHSAWEEAIESSPLYVLFNVARYLLFGFPLYLLTHKSGKKYDRHADHFLPSSPLFQESHRGQILLSDAGIAIMVGFLSYMVYITSFLTVVKFYFIPYMVLNGWLVTITYLQHTDVYLPHYSPKTWNFVRGALCTVDRDYGWFLNNAMHHVSNTHVAHHLFSTMPHYNAIKATPYLKEKLGEYYLYDRTPVFKALMRAMGRCNFVEDTGDVLFYRY